MKHTRKKKNNIREDRLQNLILHDDWKYFITRSKLYQINTC